MSLPLALQLILKKQGIIHEIRMPNDSSSQAPPAAMYAGYPPGRMPYGTQTYQQYSNQGMGIAAQNALNNMQNLKATLPASGTANGECMTRQNYTHPLMVMPSGQTVPMSAFYGQQSSVAENGGLPYVPTGIFPQFVNNTNLNGVAAQGYNWPYGLTANIPALDEARRGGSWSSEDNGPITPGVTAGPMDYYSYQYPGTSTSAQQYIAGPIQPMKTSDNKSYEMVNLDNLTQQHPAIPRAVPALWTNQEELSLAKCLQNPEGITNIYIRGFMPDTTDADLEAWASRFGEIESCKAIIEQDTGKCKGFGFVLYYSPAAAENCIRGFFHLGFQASYAQKSRNSRLKDLEDRSSTNIYCTGVPIDWNEADLCKHFLPFHAVSTKICRDSPSGVSKEVGFARFETRDIAERIIKDFHSVTVEHTGVKLYLRFADTKAQKQLKQQSQERRSWRSREYSYSVEHTPSPILSRMQALNGNVGGNSPASYISPAGASTNFTPDTSVSPAEIPRVNKPVATTVTARGSAWPTQGDLPSIVTNGTRTIASMPAGRTSLGDATQVQVPAVRISSDNSTRAKTPSPKKVTIKIEPAAGKENVIVKPQSTKTK